jgi:hypothetical protein
VKAVEQCGTTGTCTCLVRVPVPTRYELVHHNVPYLGCRSRVDDRNDTAFCAETSRKEREPTGNSLEVVIVI